jgi:hypothetical protein
VKAYADDPQGRHATIIGKLVERFGLNQEEVEQVFDEVEEEHHAEMQAQHEERLNTLVEEGKITEEQKAAIIAKQEEMRQEREANMGSRKDLTPEERKAEMEEHRNEMQAWADENGIDLSLIGGLGGRKGMGGKGGVGPGDCGECGK